MNGSESEGDWESLLDSGQLDDNIKKLTILPRPKPPTQQSSLSGERDTRVEVICSEEEARTPFKPADPVIKIMKRPEKSISGRDEKPQCRPRTEQKSLKQREQEYAEARQRILGSDDAVKEEGGNSVKPHTRTKPVTDPGVPTARLPRPPDGSKGFQPARR